MVPARGQYPRACLNYKKCSKLCQSSEAYGWCCGKCRYSDRSEFHDSGKPKWHSEECNEHGEENSEWEKEGWRLGKWPAAIQAVHDEFAVWADHRKQLAYKLLDQAQAEDPKYPKEIRKVETRARMGILQDESDPELDEAEFVPELEEIESEGSNGSGSDDKSDSPQWNGATGQWERGVDIMEPNDPIIKVQIPRSLLPKFRRWLEQQQQQMGGDEDGDKGKHAKGKCKNLDKGKHTKGKGEVDKARARSGKAKGKSKSKVGY